ncbi:class I SAM-dependent methyltransferase [Burkholderia alba]|uniref:class I SAM-dependent methyltransferase n=1 Tax=Burkholderia alba TaxID=2683677 RepID=UPI002B0610A1|nr:class I SAM-dependent methyltransferase [Burkholderia alba]
MTPQSAAASRMIHIRPTQLLSIPDRFEEEIKFFMPPAEGAGSLTTLESVALLKLMRCVEPDFLFEFGTYKGYTTRLLLENLPDLDLGTERILTLDLPALDDVVFQGDDKRLALDALGFQRKYLKSERRHLVKQLLQDSMALDPQPYLKRFQYIFIDANHELSYVRRDTEHALQMLADAPACVIWHDYGNRQFPELTQYLDDLASDLPLYHVENTMLVFHLAGIDVPERRA